MNSLFSPFNSSSVHTFTEDCSFLFLFGVDMLVAGLIQLRSILSRQEWPMYKWVLERDFKQLTSRPNEEVEDGFQRRFVGLEAQERC